MRVRLRELKPNPLRDFNVDPIDEGAVERLKQSIEEDGFWGGVVCRRQGGEIQIVAGHHRVEAAIRAGIETADLFVNDAMDDMTMTRIYARENATQRGLADGTARAGSVAAALKLAAYEVLTGDLSRFLERSDRAVSTLQRQIADEEIGIGQGLIKAYLKGVPGITDYTIQEDLASLKASGDYARIIAGVEQRITADRERAEAEAEAARIAAEKAEAAAQRAEAEAERRKAEAAQQRAAKAAEAQQRAKGATTAAAAQPITFDFKGVAQHLKVPAHIQAFRDRVTSEGLRPYVTLEMQAELAARIVALSEQPRSDGKKQELSGYFIRECISNLILQLIQREREVPAYEQAQIIWADWHAQSFDLQDLLTRALVRVVTQAERLKDHIKEAPSEAIFTPKPDYADALKKVERLIRDLREKP